MAKTREALDAVTCVAKAYSIIEMIEKSEAKKGHTCKIITMKLKNRTKGQ